ncbi:MAG: TIM barrel protein [bacterium]|nr:TIM barrel protein [bacterium]
MMNDSKNNQLIGSSISRRRFIASAGAAAVTASLSGQAVRAADSDKPKKPQVVIFSKHLQWLNWKDMAETAAEIGFDGIDLTVRTGGHVLPERVVDDLPAAVEAIHGAGLPVSMITTLIANRDTENASAVLATAGQLGIPYFRFGTFKYKEDVDYQQQRDEWKAQLQDLAGMAAFFKVVGGYHNHSGERYIGGAIWDLNDMLTGVAPEWLGSNYDIGHAFAEGARGAWETNFYLIAPRIKMSAVKDAAMYYDAGKGWRGAHPPLGEGFVDWKRVLTLMKNAGFQGPFSIHQEYDLEGKNKREQQKSCVNGLKKDLKFFRDRLKEVGWA